MHSRGSFAAWSAQKPARRSGLSWFHRSRNRQFGNRRRPPVLVPTGTWLAWSQVNDIAGRVAQEWTPALTGAESTLTWTPKNRSCCAGHRSGYGTTKGCDERWPRGPLTVRQPRIRDNPSRRRAVTVSIGRYRAGRHLTAASKLRARR